MTPARRRRRARNPEQDSEPCVFEVALALYSRESLEAAAAALGAGLELESAGSGERVRVALIPKLKLDREGLAKLAGEFLNEALSHQYRQFVAAFNMPAARPLLDAALARGFALSPSDWPREREPQVAADREREIGRLMKEARARERIDREKGGW